MVPFYSLCPALAMAECRTIHLIGSSIAAPLEFAIRWLAAESR